MSLSKLLLLLSVFTVCFKNEAYCQSIEKLGEATFLDKVWNFKENQNSFVFKGRRPAILFFGNGNGESKAMLQVMKEVCERHKGKFEIFQIDTNTSIKDLFGIKKYPTIIFVKKKSEPQSFEGFMQEPKVENLIQSLFLIR